MRLRRIVTGLAAALLTAMAAATAAQQLGASTSRETPGAAGGKLFIDSRHVEGTDFAGYRTFAWIPRDTTLDSPVLYQVPQLRDWIRDGVERALTARGFSETSYGDADFTLTYQVSVREVSVVRKRRFRTSHGYRRDRLPGWREVTEVKSTPEGTLILDVVDPDEDAVVWLGRVAGLISGAVTERGVARAIDELLEQFPPR